MTNTPDLSKLSPWEALLYWYATSDTSLPSPIKFMDEEKVYFTATHGPRSDEELSFILSDPELMQLITELWQESPPTPMVLDKLKATALGRELILRAL